MENPINIKVSEGKKKEIDRPRSSPVGVEGVVYVRMGSAILGSVATGLYKLKESET
jgi:hypothetical protein